MSPSAENRQELSSSQGARAFALAATLSGRPSQADDLDRRFGQNEGFRFASMLRAAKALELKARAIKADATRLGSLPLPAIGCDSAGDYFVLARAAVGRDGNVERVLIQHPDRQPEILDEATFLNRWDGSLLLLSSRRPRGDLNRPFGLSWFLASVARYRRILGEVLLVSLALQLIGLATPLFFQVVVDKVLVHQGLSTLDVIAVGLGIVIIFEVFLGGIRSYVFSHTTNRIDVELGTRLFDQLVHLPLAYFGARRVGDSVARVRELENIRQILTGSALTLVLDVIFACIFIAVIFIYSIALGLVVIGAVPLYATISVLATPTLRRRIEDKFRLGAENQAFLVETVTGMETVKAMAVEPIVQRKWEEQLAGYVRSAFRVTSLGVLASQSALLVSRGTTLLILYVGARLVMRETITIGELVAVNMLAGQISSPILRLAQLWQDFQQVRVSVERVGDIMNTPAELRQKASASARPILKGDISFEDVSFRYRPDGPPVLNGLSVRLRAGTVLGIVGSSGSGKSTLTKLIQRLHVPESGRVTIDGVDIAMLDPAWLRRQIGVVLQESVLFNATVRQNIALVDPTIGMDRIMTAARLAGAHDFIAAMPEGYDAAIGERGASLSGGQRQRIAIARALVTNPRILILDEATSALDLESEQAIQANMAAIARGRTVIIVAHRLSALRSAERIVTVEKGRVIEDGAPQELLRAKGRFAQLYAAQSLSFPAVSVA